ncbi:MAG: beta/gamma crystallin-related protein [Hyphomonas sp.]|uniref:beta/gamma crystallin-related protein n=1 Tax=Hyphomonas sp. TaxID=87 RepID=UPI00352757F2
MNKKTPSVSVIALLGGLAALALPASADHGSGRGYGYGGDYRGGGAVMLYSDSHFSGEALPINGAIPTLTQYRFNDRASSIEIRSGVWQVCVDANYRGRCEIIDANVPTLTSYRLNDAVSSLRPLDTRRAGYGGYRGNDGPRRGGWGARLVLYPDAYLRGQPIEIDRDVPTLSPYRFNDLASSFEVSGGTWLVCEHSNYRGRCEVLSSGAGDLSQIRMNNTISSIRRIDGRGY